MESIISDETSDVEMKTLKDQLKEFGLEDENLTKEEMRDLVKALNNSKSTEKDDEILRQKTDIPTVDSSEKTLKRRYVNVKDRRLPWSILPSNLTNSEKARVLAVYIKIMSINKYWQARQNATFASWPPSLQIIEETSIRSLRSTRSGRSVPMYTGDMDDDSSDFDFVIKPKKRKISGSETNEGGVYSNKVVSLKRKPLKDDHRPMKELKLNNTSNKIEAISSSATVKPKREILHIED